jgi:hypothetical protein
MQISYHRSLLFFLGGISTGVCLSIIGGAILLATSFKTASPPTVTAMPTTMITNTISAQLVTPSPTFTQLPQPNPLDEAEEALNSGNPEKVRGLLYPMIETWTSNDDRVRGYELLGKAEWAQGHPQLATPHFEKLYFYEPTAENLFTLATAYDAGGNICLALKKYQELAKWEPPPPGVDIELVKLRIEQISCALGTPVPTKTAPPN